MNDDQAYHTIIGLPRSGKTTYLAALWHLIDADEVSTQLVLNRLEGDFRHLNTIVDAWRRCDEVPRTSIAAETDVSIWVQERATGRKARLGFPDLSGESFEQQVAMRHCRKCYIDNLDGNGGIMLFLTADRPDDEVTLCDMVSIMTGEKSEADVPTTWTPRLVPQQVQLVELLQFLQHSPFRRVQRRLAVIVSAWDVITDPNLSPTAWLERELPLLYQFLLSNDLCFSFRVYGISAQGGDVNTAIKAELLGKTPSERVVCVDDGARSHDLTAPILWLMAGN